MYTPTPAEKLIVRKMEENISEGYDAGTALVRTSNELGVPRGRILEIWSLKKVAAIA